MLGITYEPGVNLNFTRTLVFCQRWPERDGCQDSDENQAQYQIEDQLQYQSHRSLRFTGTKLHGGTPTIFSCSAVLGMICAYFKALTHAGTNRRMDDKFRSRNL